MSRSLYLDMLDGDEGPQPGDFLCSVGQRGTVGSRYRVLSSYRVKRRDPQAPPRWQMQVEVVDEIPGGVYVFEFHWYPRNKKRLNFEQYMKR